jgi:hypothetical protein
VRWCVTHRLFSRNEKATRQLVAFFVRTFLMRELWLKLLLIKIGCFATQ